VNLFRRIRYAIIDLYMRTDVWWAFWKCLQDEWRSQAEWEEFQARRRRELAEHAARMTSFYARLFAECGFRPEHAEDAAEWQKLPILTKQTIRANFSDLIARDFRRYAPRISRTSGSTGEPLTVYHTGLSHTYLRALNFAGWAQRGYRLGDPYAAFAGGSLLPDALGFQQRVYAWLQHCYVMPSYHLSRDRFERYLTILRARRIAYVYGYASALYDFSLQMQDRQRELPPLRGVFTTADMLFPAQRRFIEHTLGTEITDIYGNPESGLMSYECDRHSGFHYGMQNAWVEIVDDQGAPVPEGTVGRVVVTSLNNFSFPMLRYDTGDEGALCTAPCACGRGYHRIVQLAGRSRDYIVLPDGRHIHGAFFNHLKSIYEADWLMRYHIHQPSREEIVFQCLCRRPPTPAELEAIASEIRTGTGHLIRVTMEVKDELPLTRRGKYKLITRAFDEGRPS